MIGSILMCDRCGESVRAGAEPSPTGRGTRLAAWRGSIRRVRLGYTVGSATEHRAARRTLRSVDLCGRCRTPEIIAAIVARETHTAERYGQTFEEVKR